MFEEALIDLPMQSPIETGNIRLFWVIILDIRAEVKLCWVEYLRLDRWGCRNERYGDSINIITSYALL